MTLRSRTLNKGLVTKFAQHDHQGTPIKFIFFLHDSILERKINTKLHHKDAETN